MNKAQRFSMFSMAIAVWFGISLACGMVSPKEEPPRVSTRVVSTGSALSQTPAIPSSKLGETVELLGYSLTVTKVEERQSPEYYPTPKPGIKILAVEMILGNLSGAEPLRVFTMYVNLVDSNGFVYEADGISLISFEEDRLGYVTLNIGEKVKGWVYFMIPDSVTPAYIKFNIDDENFLRAGLGE